MKWLDLLSLGVDESVQGRSHSLISLDDGLFFAQFLLQLTNFHVFLTELSNVGFLGLMWVIFLVDVFEYVLIFVWIHCV